MYVRPFPPVVPYITRLDTSCSGLLCFYHLKYSCRVRIGYADGCYHTCSGYSSFQLCSWAPQIILSLPAHIHCTTKQSNTSSSHLSAYWGLIKSVSSEFLESTSLPCRVWPGPRMSFSVRSGVCLLFLTTLLTLPEHGEFFVFFFSGQVMIRNSNSSNTTLSNHTGHLCSKCTTVL